MKRRYRLQRRLPRRNLQRDGGSGHVGETSLTAFPDTEKWLREACADAELDISAFQRRLARCDLAGCRGMCCYDGVYVDRNTAEVLQRISRERAADFEEIRLTLPSAVITEGIWRDHSSGLKTATKPVDIRSKVSGFPDHFDDTSCVFRADDGRCSLQTLGAKTGRHPWFYKPLVCWLHPINVSPERITIYDENTDPYRYPDYDGFASRTFCGRTAALGRPAYEVLRAELELLGHILGRDLTSQFPAAGTEGA
jgi:hypothetical protein